MKLERALDDLARDGVALLPAHVRGAELAALRGDFFRILEDERSSPRFLAKGDSRVARLDGGLGRYASAAAFFGRDPALERIAREYFAPHGYTLNRQVYVTHDVNRQEFSGAWHIDPGQCLKFMLYLVDTTRDNGAFMYGRGSHRECLYRILYHRARGDGERFPIWFPDDEVRDPLHLEGPAGTLEIFSTAGQHRAGAMRPGSERLVMRGHSYCRLPRLHRLRNLLLRSPLNLARYPLVEDGRINERFKSRAT